MGSLEVRFGHLASRSPIGIWIGELSLWFLSKPPTQSKRKLTRFHLVGIPLMTRGTRVHFAHLLGTQSA